MSRFKKLLNFDVTSNKALFILLRFFLNSSQFLFLSLGFILLAHQEYDLAIQFFFISIMHIVFLSANNYLFGQINVIGNRK